MWQNLSGKWFADKTREGNPFTSSLSKLSVTAETCDDARTTEHAQLSVRLWVASSAQKKPHNEQLGYCRLQVGMLYCYY